MGLFGKDFPKLFFVGFQTLKLGTTDAISSFNDGSIGKVNVLEQLGIKPGKFMVQGLMKIYEERIKKMIKKRESKIKRRESKEDWKKGRVKTVKAKNILLGDFSNLIVILVA